MKVKLMSKTKGLTVREPISELHSVICRIKSRSFTCHSTQVNMLASTPVRNSSTQLNYPRKMGGWADHVTRDQPNPREKMHDFMAEFLKCVKFHRKFTKRVSKIHGPHRRYFEVLRYCKQRNFRTSDIYYTKSRLKTVNINYLVLKCET